jgi:hypothetical protein
MIVLSSILRQAASGMVYDTGVSMTGGSTTASRKKRSYAIRRIGWVFMVRCIYAIYQRL